MNQDDKVELLRQIHELQDLGMKNGLLQAKHGRLAQANYWRGYVAALDQMAATVLELPVLPAETP